MELSKSRVLFLLSKGIPNFQYTLIFYIEYYNIISVASFISFDDQLSNIFLLIHNSLISSILLRKRGLWHMICEVVLANVGIEPEAVLFPAINYFWDHHSTHKYIKQTYRCNSIYNNCILIPNWARRVPMVSYQEDIASKLLHSSDARIAEAAKRVFSSSLPHTVAASLAALSNPLPAPSAMMNVLDELPIYSQHGDMSYAQNTVDGAEQYFQNNSGSDPGNSTGGNDEVSDDYEECDQKPSSTERLKRR